MRAALRAGPRAASRASPATAAKVSKKCWGSSRHTCSKPLTLALNRVLMTKAATPYTPAANAVPKRAVSSDCTSGNSKSLPVVKPLSRSSPKMRCLRLILASTLLAVDAKKPMPVAAQMRANIRLRARARAVTCSISSAWV